MIISGILDYILRGLEISILPFVIGFLLAPRLEELVRGGYSASGGAPCFVLKSPITLTFLVLTVALIVGAGRHGQDAAPVNSGV